jgi:LPXTG-motif cell wall-anchored protein
MGDGTDTYYSVYTVTTGAAQATLPVGMYEVVDEPTQAHVYVTIEEGSNEAHIVYPKAAPAVTPVPTSVAQPTAVPKATAPAVTKLPSTGSGPESNLAAMGVMVAGAVLTAGAIGMRLRKH